jgi:hypothetical protein
MTTPETILPTSGGGRPATYRTKDGKRVPGVTTVLRYKDPARLIGWAYKMGKEGRDLQAERDKAGDVGKVVHGWIESEIHGRSLDLERTSLPSDDLGRAIVAFEAFKIWRKNVNLVVVSTEQPLVSELHSFGGTYDAIAVVDGRPMLMDWKTGGGIYPETIAQLAAYRQLIRENVGNKRDLAPESAVCLRIGKEYGDFHEHRYTSEILDSGWRRFLGAKMMYDEDERLTKVCQ